MCNLYSITTNQAAISALFWVVNQYVGNLPPMPGIFPDYQAPVGRNAGAEREMVLMRWGMPPPPKFGGPPVTNIRNTNPTGAPGEAGKPVSGTAQQLRRIRPRAESRNQKEGRRLVRDE